jgi:TPR repeat protein
MREHAEACYSLGVLHQNGTGVPRQPGRAASLIRRSCDLGYAEACPKERPS